MENITTAHYSAGEVIIKEGDHSNSVFLIISGKVKITKRSKTGEIVLCTQGKNTIIGEMNIIDGRSRSASVITIEDTYCYRANSASLIRELQKVDGALFHALRSMVAKIRKNNKEIVFSEKYGDDVLIEDIKENDEYFMGEEQINDPEIQKKIEEIEHPFTKGLFRVLMTTAFKK